jgi:DNA-directed RNA polymerase subunit M/transcription elongation factor TFIIS
MGRQFDAICQNCGNRFFVREGPGMLFFLLHCNQCGREKGVGTDEIIAANLSWKDDEGINKLAGECSCGGNYDVNAKARCPKCRSNDYVVAPDGQHLLYD